MDISIAFMLSIPSQRQEKWLTAATAATGGKGENSLPLSWVSTAYMVFILFWLWVYYSSAA
jgi:hypothetical protein